MPDREIFRRLTQTDIPSAMELSAEAGWNQTAADWQLVLELAPETCYAIEVEGKLAATATLVCYGTRLAWIGMVLTTQKFRGRGFARRLLAESLAEADRRHIESVKLDATDQGQPLYEKLGFRVEQPIERWSNTCSQSLAELPRKADAQANWTSDYLVFGADRSQLLTKLAANNPPQMRAASYLFHRPGRNVRYLGPCVGTHGDVAPLIEASLPSASAWYWDLLPNNSAAVALARNFDFQPQRHLMRMVRGKDLDTNDQATFAIAGFELG
jgi:GNAT superfamily N-acetyltransferase